MGGLGLLPGGMPGPDPFQRLRYPEPNNNLMMAAEKARLMMLGPGRGLRRTLALSW